MRTRLHLSAGWAAVVISAAALSAQQPLVQNGRLDARPGAGLAETLARAAAASAAPAGTPPAATWVAWRVPMVAGERDLCSTWSSDDRFERGVVLGPRPGGEMPHFAPPAGPVQLEAGTGLLLLARIMDGGIERLRVLNDNCPIDAGTAALVWLPDVTPAESLRVLDELTQDVRASATDGSWRVAKSAVTAIGLHHDPAADAILDRLAQSADGPVWPQAVQALATARGAHGFKVVVTLLDAARERSARRTLTSALGQTHEPETAARLLALARTDTDPTVRGDAVYWYVQRAGEAGIPDVTRLLASEHDANVERRAVSAIATLPAATSVPLLINLAGPSASLTVRKAAVSALGRSTDARAAVFLEDLVAR